ncbi:MAG: hypothetical protein APF82_08850 [Sphingomonadales bacterium BRH_c42]|nr:MAG: hypothetical protein APF82_08850 [Sphingomonadales bacterium BRH_c42]
MMRVLAVASGGGHWEQLLLLRDAFSRHEIHFATTSKVSKHEIGAISVQILPDCNLRQPLRTLECAVRSAFLIARLRPQIVISTGAAPGLLCIFWGRVMGARTLWIDSIANADRLSLSGRLAMRIAHRCLTQWEHLARERTVHYAGALL